MLATRLRIAQVIELCIYGAIAAAIHRRMGWTAVEALAFVAASVLGVRLLLVAASFAITHLRRSPRPAELRIGPLPALFMVLREWVTLAKFNLLYFPWERAFLRPDPPPVPGGGTPVVLVHGYFANRGNFCLAVRRLEAGGIGPVFAPNLRSFMAPIERFEEDLHAAVERIVQGTGKPVILVGHSMGGLGIRAYLARRGTERVAKVVMVGSPHHGTVLAPLGQGENARQMRIGSRFLAELESAEGARGPGVPATCIYTAHDNMVAPQETSRLPWASNIALKGLGHLELIEAPEVIELLRKELR